MATWYCDYTDGNDTTGTGTAANPYKTIQKCHDEATIGDTIIPAADTYSEALVFTKSITLSAAEAGTVTVKPAAGNSACLDLNANGVTTTIQNVDFDGSLLDNANSNGIYTNNSGTITIEDCTITPPTGNTTDYGIRFSSATLVLLRVVISGDVTNVIKQEGTSGNITLTDCTMTQTGTGGNCINGAATFTGPTITVIRGTYSITATGNTDDVINAGANNKLYCLGALVIHKGTSSTAGECVGIAFNTTAATQLQIVYNCTVAAPTCIRNSTVATYSGKASIKNCGLRSTVAGTNVGCIYFSNASGEADTAMDYNGYYPSTGCFYGRIVGTDYDTLAAWKTACSDETNAVDGDPSFTDPDTDDYTIGASSTWLNAGVDVGLGYAGSAPDIGYYEVESSSMAMTGIYDFKQADGTQYPLCVCSGTVNIFDRTPETEESGFTPIGSGFTPDADSCWDFQTDSDTCWMLGAAEALHKWDGQTNDTGTIALTNGSTAVVGSGTDFTDPALGADGKLHVTATGEVLTIASVTDETNIVLASAYQGPTQASLAFTAYTYQPADGSPPSGKYIRVFNNYLFLAGNSTYPSRLYWSNLKDFETWGGSDFIDINREDGDPITALFLLGDYLYIGKEDTLWRLTYTGDSLFPFELRKAADVGVRSHWSVAGISDVKFFLSGDGVYMVSVDSLPQKISEPIETSDELLGTATSRWDNAVALFQPDRREYWLFIAGSGQVTNTVVYMFDVGLQAWAKWTGWSFNVVGQVESVSNTWTPYGGDYSGNIYELDSGTNDNASAIDFQIETGAYDYGSPALRKQLRQIFLFCSEDSAWTMVVSHRTDFNTWNSQTILSTGDETSGSGIHKRRIFITTDNIGYWHELKFRNNEADKPLVIYGWSLLPKPAGVQ